MVALAECGTHAFVAAEVDAYRVGEKTLAARLYPRLRADELLTADRNFYSWQAWDTARRPGRRWCGGPRPTRPARGEGPARWHLPLGLIKPSIRGARRDRAALPLAAADGPRRRRRTPTTNAGRPVATWPG